MGLTKTEEVGTLQIAFCQNHQPFFPQHLSTS